MPVYSFGIDSPLKFEMSDELAEAYNAALRNFMDAQRKFKEETGRTWNPMEDALMLQHSTPAAFNAFAEIFNKAIENHGTTVHEDELTDDFLVRN